MTKTFEEDLNEKLNSEKVPMYITQKGCSLTRKTFIETNWLFANYGNYHSDEEFQEMKESYWNQAESILSMLDEIKSLKSQLQQQALPVVPELTQKQADILNDYKNGSGSLASYLSTEIKKGDYDYFARAWLDGYEVEKPQQKHYEVKLLSGESMHFNPIGNSKNIKDYRFSFGNYAGWKTQFTKSELAEIKDGMFLKRIPGGTPLDDLGKDKSYYVWLNDCNYWINPLIELVPVEDGE